MATNLKTEIKQSTGIVAAPAFAATKSEQQKTQEANGEPSAKEKFKSYLEALDAERANLVKSTIENLKPGAPFDHAALREIQKIEVRKNRLIVGHFAALLKKNAAGIAPIVHQIIEI